MHTKVVEATNLMNWGKFLLCKFTKEEWAIKSKVSEGEFLIRGRGWDDSSLFVMDLQTGEGAMFHPSNFAIPEFELEKHQIWVCPMFAPFLDWLYKQDVSDIDQLPDVVDMPKNIFAFSGYRRKGPDQETRDEADIDGRAKRKEPQEA